jgi:non-ribosomal peptide synthetase component E (peptide arylation enzyme)
MPIEGFTPYDPELAKLYTKKRWWLGLTMGDTLDRAADMYPGKEAVVEADGKLRRLTYGELRSQADSMAYNLLKQGLKPGDFVLLMLPNIVEFVVSYYALQKAGLVMVLLTVNHSAREINHLASLTEPKGLVIPDRYRKTDYAQLVAEVRAAHPAIKVVQVAETKPAADIIWYHDLQKLDADAATVSAALDAARPDPGEVCQILPSGGTTGLPKGCPRTHDDYLCNVEYKSKAWHWSVDDTHLVATTVGHNLALLVGITAAVFHGAKQVLVDSTRPADFLAAVEKEKCTRSALVPTLVSRIVASEDLGKYDVSSLQRVYVGAANSPPELVKAAEEKLGIRYVNAFGMVEGPCSQSRPPDDLYVRCNTIGRPVCPYDTFATLDPEGRPTARGVEGELAAKGPGIFTGYFRNPQANMQSFTPDGFFRSGDLAVIEESGNIRITGRIKDIIIRGGENIAARDVEDAISAHDAVEYVAAVGMPDKDLGEVVCAFIKPKPGRTLTLEEIVAFMKAEGASNTILPARIELVDDMPLTAAGKADKKVLKQVIVDKLATEGK